MFKTTQNWWPAIGCIAIYYALLTWAVCTSTQTTGGQLIYPLDDTYIHMAMAKNFSEHGVWGFTRYAFSSSTTSPLYTALLAVGYFILGPNEVLPLALNVLLGTILFVYLYRLFRQEVTPLMVFTLLLVISFVTSFPALTLLGMEHLLHTLLTLAFVCLGATALATSPSTLSHHRALLLITALLPMARYEGCFAVAVVCGFLFLQKRYRFAIQLATAGALPIFLYGIVSHTHDWLFLPNSVILKGCRPDFSSIKSILNAFGLHSISVLVLHPVMLLLLILTLVNCFHSDRSSTSNGTNRAWWRCVIFLCILFMHLQTASIGWLYRYEAYLVGVGLALTLPLVLRMLPPALPMVFPFRLRCLPLAIPVIGLVVSISPMFQRGWIAWRDTRRAIHDRYLEHIQPARFLNAYYQGATVVVNDIGAVAYYTDCHLLDMYGLGNMEPVRFRLGKSGYTKEQVQDWTTSENAEIAVLQVEWYEVYPRIPDSWVKVAEWKIPRNVVFGDHRIGWFATKQDAAETLTNHLLAFKPNIPKDIEVTMTINSPNKPDAGDGK